MNTEDGPRFRLRLIIRVTHRLLIDKVIRSSGGELFDAVVEAPWVHGVHFRWEGRWGKSYDRQDFFPSRFKSAIPC